MLFLPGAASTVEMVMIWTTVKLQPSNPAREWEFSIRKCDFS